MKKTIPSNNIKKMLTLSLLASSLFSSENDEFKMKYRATMAVFNNSLHLANKLHDSIELRKIEKGLEELLALDEQNNSEPIPSDDILILILNVVSTRLVENFWGFKRISTPTIDIKVKYINSFLKFYNRLISMYNLKPDTDSIAHIYVKPKKKIVKKKKKPRDKAKQKKIVKKKKLPLVVKKRRKILKEKIALAKKQSIMINDIKSKISGAIDISTPNITGKAIVVSCTTKNNHAWYYLDDTGSIVEINIIKNYTKNQLDKLCSNYGGIEFIKEDYDDWIRIASDIVYEMENQQ